MTDTQTPAHDPGTNRLDDRLDALLSLMDRQIADRDGRLVGKVDDLELTEQEDGDLNVTGILTGPAALVARLGGNHDRGLLGWWQRLSPARGDRLVPGWIDIDDVEALGSGVELSVVRDGLIRRQGDAPPGTTLRRLGHMLGMKVVGPAGDPLHCHVIDVRLEPEVAESGLHPRVTSMIVGNVRTVFLLGYDRAQVNGPLPVAKLLAWLGRHTRELAWEDVDRIDWDDQTVHATRMPKPLREIDSDAGSGAAR
jgi:hypothetical protein